MFLERIGTASSGQRVSLDRVGLAALGGDEVQALNHGNQLRIRLAAALVFALEILILDEPFAGLDPVTVDEMSTLLREQTDAGIPMLFSIHQRDLVERLCDRAGIIRRGRIVACGMGAALVGGEPERQWVDGPSVPEGWMQVLPGVTVLRLKGTRAQLDLAPGSDDQEALYSAVETGPAR